MLAEITRHSRFTAEEFQALATELPVDVPGLHRRIRTLREANALLPHYMQEMIPFIGPHIDIMGPGTKFL